MMHPAETHPAVKQLGAATTADPGSNDYNQTPVYGLNHSLLCLQEQHATKQSVQVCLYCRQPCGTDMFSVEPMWCCSWCPAVCHMRCYRELHPLHSPDGPSTRHHSLDHTQQPASSTTASSAAAAAATTTQLAVKRHRSRSLDSRSTVGHAVQDRQHEGFGSQEDLARHKWVVISPSDDKCALTCICLASPHVVVIVVPGAV